MCLNDPPRRRGLYDDRCASHLAKRDGPCERYAGQLLPLAWLAPDLVESILAGTQPPVLSLGTLTKQPLPADWDAQRRMFASAG